MRRLYWQIYLTALGILLLFWVLVAVVWTSFDPEHKDRQLFDGVGRVVSALVPAADRPAAEQRAELARLAEWFDVQLALFDEQGKRLAEVGEGLPPPPAERMESGWVRGRGHGPTAALRLTDGRWLVVRHRRRHTSALVALALLAIASAVGAYPLVRRLTRRLERLQGGVERLGSGELGTRLEVEGRDEVAALARSFNRTAERLERLVDAQRQVLAGASHELRSPLTRLRLAAELLRRPEDAEVRQRLVRDIAQLDELIDELLLASRLEAGADFERPERVDLLALAAEEAAPFGGEVSGDSVELLADPRLLRRLLRNLLDNARRHAGGTPPEVEVAPLPDGGALLRVRDRGPGVPEADRERIFEPFHRAAGHGESTAGGVGLGLALVRRIARRYGGEARYVPMEQGCAFEVRLRGAELRGSEGVRKRGSEEARKLGSEGVRK